jgi:hypothetical protein
MNFDCKKMHPKCQAQCCGVVPIPKDIYNNHQEKIYRVPMAVIEADDHLIPITSDAYCPFLNDKFECNIYEDRPPVCRKFGDESHPMLYCPFLDKKGKERKTKETTTILNRVNRFIDKLKIIT